MVSIACCVVPDRLSEIYVLYCILSLDGLFSVASENSIVRPLTFESTPRHVTSFDTRPPPPRWTDVKFEE